MLNYYRLDITSSDDYEGEPMMPGEWYMQSCLGKCTDLIADFKANWDLPLDFDEDNTEKGVYAFRRTLGMFLYKVDIAVVKFQQRILFANQWIKSSPSRSR